MGCSKSFLACISFLKDRVSYCFEDERKEPLKWLISTWSVKIKRSSIEKFGNANDVLKLPAPTNRNASRASNLKRKRTQSQIVLYPTRQER